MLGHRAHPRSAGLAWTPFGSPRRARRPGPGVSGAYGPPRRPRPARRSPARRLRPARRPAGRRPTGRGDERLRLAAGTPDRHHPRPGRRRPGRPGDRRRPAFAAGDQPLPAVRRVPAVPRDADDARRTRSRPVREPRAGGAHRQGGADRTVRAGRAGERTLVPLDVPGAGPRGHRPGRVGLAGGRRRACWSCGSSPAGTCGRTSTGRTRSGPTRCGGPRTSSGSP